MSDSEKQEPLVSIRRTLHRRPEPAWCEFYTTATIVQELRKRELTALHYGRDALGTDVRSNVPDDEERVKWRKRAAELGVSSELLDAMDRGYTGAVAVREFGDGPTVGVRVDIDGLPISEAKSGHQPADNGFRSKNNGYMHACGHDAHAAIGLGVVDRIEKVDFDGTLKLFFQPAEERGSGAQPMVESGHADNLDYLLAVHVGLGHPTGEVVAGIDDFLAIRDFVAEFTGESAHAGVDPEGGRNALLAAADAATSIHAISRHSDGLSRVNVGTINAGAAPNVVADEARLQGQVRGETTEIMEYMSEEAERRLQAAADMYDVEFTLPPNEGTIAPSARSDQELVELTATLAPQIDGVDSLVRRGSLGGSEDATHLMRHVQQSGGKASYIGIGTDHPGDHHTPEFDVDERSLEIGVSVISTTIEGLQQETVTASED